MSVTVRRSLDSHIRKLGLQLAGVTLRLIVRDPTFRHGLQLLGRGLARRRAAARSHQTRRYSH